MKRYRVDAQECPGAIWEAVYYTDDLAAARRYASGLLAGGRVVAVRVVHQQTGEVNYELQHD